MANGTIGSATINLTAIERIECAIPSPNERRDEAEDLTFVRIISRVKF